ncbi:MAG: phosphoglucosamine mutase [Prevotellaceae bacterium]|nr:phosphoglucosamine mutase [Prevotellaceae bacterium]
MSLIKSISGIRGTIGGRVGEGLNPVDIVRFTAAFATVVRQISVNNSNKIVVGRDARISGEMLSKLVSGTLMGMGFDVVNIGLATTPTTELAVTMERAAGGVILTASHNPRQWNALKLLNEKGEFLDAQQGEMILNIAQTDDFTFAQVDNTGKYFENFSYTKKHIEHVLSLQLVDVEAIREANFTIAIDCVNSVGGIAIPQLLDALGVVKVEKIYCEPDGQFPHNPEPLAEHLTDLSALVRATNASAGFAVDPDVDRLAIVCENGDMFGEEYTLVSVADYVLSATPGNTVSNLSSTRALRDVTDLHKGIYAAAAVGEVNVVSKMKEIGAVIGGEGNGGVIYPASHYGRDALVGIALFLTHLAKQGKTVSELKKQYPQYFISKNRIELTPEIDVDKILSVIKEKYKSFEITDIDGLKIDFADGWVHLRKSNTEPIIRIYSEAKTTAQAEIFANEIIAQIQNLI